eukprot:6182267-Pleurochrysis_carterae.AAC.2
MVSKHQGPALLASARDRACVSAVVRDGSSVAPTTPRDEELAGQAVATRPLASPSAAISHTAQNWRALRCM